MSVFKIAGTRATPQFMNLLAGLIHLHAPIQHGGCIPCEQQSPSTFNRIDSKALKACFEGAYGN
jgi:hypothetical protein